MRKPRLHVPAAFYHVTLRGNHRQDIFFSPDDRVLLNGIVAEVIPHYGARLHAYCWMTNHVHMLVQVSDTPLGRIMLRIASRYARELQARFHTTGHLFERRYHAVLVDADAYLLELARYIHLNPVRARMAAAPADYPWSSHHAYLGQRSESWVTTEFALSLFHPELHSAHLAYQRFVHDPSMPTDSPLKSINQNDKRILGNDTFAAKLLGSAWQPRSRKTLDMLMEEACEQFKTSRDALMSASRSRHLTHARAWVAHQALLLRITTLTRVAEVLGRTDSALRQSIKHHFNYP
jgi:REP element-mobilizing transposase RayT